MYITHVLYSGPAGAMASDPFLRGVRAVILERGLGRGRAGILRKQLSRWGGRVEEELSPDTTHLLVGNKVRRMRLPALLGGTEVPPSVMVVRADWLSGSLQQGRLLGEEEYVVPRESPSQADKEGGRGEEGGEGGGKEGRGEGGGGGRKEGRGEGGGGGKEGGGGEVGGAGDVDGDVVKMKEVRSPAVEEEVEREGVVSNAGVQTPAQKVSGSIARHTILKRYRSQLRL